MDELQARLRNQKPRPKFDISFNDFLALYNLNGQLVSGRNNPYQVLWKKYQSEGAIPPEELDAARTEVGDDGKAPPPENAHGALMAELHARTNKKAAKAPDANISFPDFLKRFYLKTKASPDDDHPYTRLWRQYQTDGGLSQEEVKAAVKAAAEEDALRDPTELNHHLKAGLGGIRLYTHHREASPRGSSDDKEQWAED